MRVALAIVCALTATAAADVELKNDSFTEGSQVAFQGGFVSGEIAAAQFNAPDAGRTLLKVQLLFGGVTATEMVTLIVYDDTAGTVAPGTVLYRGDFQVMGSNSAIHELTPDETVTLPAKFRIGIQVVHDGPPSVACDKDGQTGKNFIFAIPGDWMAAPSPALGDWIFRPFISGEPGPGPGPVGGPCTANPDCPTGEFCDTAAGACTFECRTDPDCGEGTCNSLGQCVGGDDGAGGCCQSSRDGELPALLFGAGVLGLLIRRRRCAR